MQAAKMASLVVALSIDSIFDMMTLMASVESVRGIAEGYRWSENRHFLFHNQYFDPCMARVVW
jgi:hypothetical protein